MDGPSLPLPEVGELLGRDCGQECLDLGRHPVRAQRRVGVQEELLG